MTNDDLKKLGTLMDSKLDKFKSEIGKDIAASKDELREEISTSGKRLRNEVLTTRAGLKKEIAASKNDLRAEIAASEKRVIRGIVDFVSDHLLPLIDEKSDKSDVERIERELDSNIDKTVELKSRVEKIESLPTVAHELRVKRKR